MTHDDKTLDESECLDLLDRLFPDGPAGADVMAELAPGGWENGPLAAVYHPADDGDPDHEQSPVDADAELRELVGRCLWDVFSDNHDVSVKDGRIAHLGSFRAGGGLIADWVNRHLGHPPKDEDPEAEMRAFMEKMNAFSAAFQAKDHDAMTDLTRPAERDGVRVYEYVDFYMGSRLLQDRADLSPVWRMIFRRLRELGCDWTYSFPRLGMVRFERPEQDDPTTYDPSAAFAAEQEREEKDREAAEMQERLDAAYRESVEAALDRPPPGVVLAYEAEYGELPQGWPPEVEDE